MKYTPSQVVAQLLRDLSIATDPKVGGKWPSVAMGMPDDPNELIAITNNSTPSQGRIQRSGETITKPGIQVRVRSDNANNAQEVMSAIYNAFDGLKRRGVIVKEMRYLILAIHNQHSPVDTGKDERKRNVFSLNCLMSVREVPKNGSTT